MYCNFHFSRYVLASAIRDMNTSEEINAPPSDCDNSGSIWTTGHHLFDYIRKQKLENGATGYVAFDDHGDRVHAEYDMVNVRAQGEHVAVGKYFYSKVLFCTNSLSIMLTIFV